LIKACVFDMGGVILAFDFNPFYEKVLPHCANGVGRAELEALAAQRHETLGRGYMSFQEYYDRFRTELGVNLGIEEFAEAWNDIFTAMPATIALLPRLQGVEKILLSNTDVSHIGWVEKRFPEMLARFDRRLYSHEIHAIKPAPEAFHAVERATGRPAAEHVMIDDVEENLIAAQALGWEGILFTGAEDLEEKLRELGVEIEETK